MHIAWHLVKVLPTIQRSITLPPPRILLGLTLCRQLNLPKLTLWSSMVTAKLRALPVISLTMLWSLPFPGPTTASSPLIHTFLWWASNLISSSTAQNTPSVLVLEKPGFSWGTLSPVPSQADGVHYSKCQLPQHWKKHSKLPSLLLVASNTITPLLICENPYFFCAHGIN